jgi:hypothetical protein
MYSALLAVVLAVSCLLFLILIVNLQAIRLIFPPDGCRWVDKAKKELSVGECSL